MNNSVKSCQHMEFTQNPIKITRRPIVVYSCNVLIPRGAGCWGQIKLLSHHMYGGMYPKGHPSCDKTVLKLFQTVYWCRRTDEMSFIHSLGVLGSTGRWRGTLDEPPAHRRARMGCPSRSICYSLLRPSPHCWIFQIMMIKRQKVRYP